MSLRHFPEDQARSPEIYIRDVPAAEFDSDPAKPGFVYLRLADYIADEIASGQIPLGGRLMGEKEAAMEYGVSNGTMRRTIRVLRSRGLVETYHGKGTWVVAREPTNTAED